MMLQFRSLARLRVRPGWLAPWSPNPASESAARPVRATESPLEKLLLPRPFLLGMSLAFVLCCVAGWLTTLTNPLGSLCRFYRGTSIEAHFYPTAAQIRNRVRGVSAPERHTVLIGGNSILLGIGQRTDNLWFKHLQTLLGPQYDVVNLSAPGGRIGDYAQVAAEMIEAERPNLLHVTIIMPAAMGKDCFDTLYSFLFWDAFYKGMLPHDAEREEFIQRRLQAWADKEETDSSMPELLRQMSLDAGLRFRDLWNWMTYEVVSTVWAPEAKFPKPRKLVPDVIKSVAPFKAERVTRARIRGETGHLVMEPVDVARRHCAIACRCVPERLRGRTLICLFRHNPYVLSQLTPAQRQRYEELYPELEKQLEATGFATLRIGVGYQEHDYVDTKHLSESGGVLLAEALSAKIAQLTSTAPQEVNHDQ